MLFRFFIARLRAGGATQRPQFWFLDAAAFQIMGLFQRWDNFLADKMNAGRGPLHTVRRA